MLSEKQKIQRRLRELHHELASLNRKQTPASKMLTKRHEKQIVDLEKRLVRMREKNETATNFIKDRLKTCKGTGKAKGYGCGKDVPMVKYNQANRVYGLGKSCGCYGEWLLGTEEGKKKTRKATLKATRQSRELKQAAMERSQRRSHAKQIQKTQRIINQYVRLRDKGKDCISSGIPYLPDFDAGHCFSVKGYAGLRFDLDNIHGQSINANRFKDGDETNYLLRLEKRIGKERTDALIERAKDYKKNGRKFSVPELIEIQNEIKQKIKLLTKD